MCFFQSAGVVTTTLWLDFETNPTYDVDIRVIDKSTKEKNKDDEIKRLQIVPQNSAPVIHTVASSVDILETQVDAFRLSSISAMDVDPDDNLDYSLTVSPTAGPFSIDNNGECLLSQKTRDVTSFGINGGPASQTVAQR